MAYLTHQNMNNLKKSYLAKINGGLEKALFQKNASKRGEFQIVKKTTFLILLFENLCNSPLFEAFFKRSAFSRPPLIFAKQYFFLGIHILVGRMSHPTVYCK